MKKVYLKDISHILVKMNNAMHYKMKKLLIGIRSKKHKIVTYTSNKKSISCFDNKHYILSDGINTLPYGHKDTPKNE